MEGGMVLTDDEELCHLARSLRSHGWTRGLPDPSPIYERRESDLFEEYRFIPVGLSIKYLPIATRYTTSRDTTDRLIPFVRNQFGLLTERLDHPHFRR